MKSRLTVVPNKRESKKKKPYIFCARLNYIQTKQLNAMMYQSEATHAQFLGSILSMVDFLCKTGKAEGLSQVFGTEFYLKFIRNYLDNLYLIEKYTGGGDNYVEG